MDRFETDVMDDLMSDAAEGPAHNPMDAYDEADEDVYDEGDYADEGDDEFLGRIAGHAAGAFDGYDEADEYDLADEADEADGFDGFDEVDAGDELDAMEDAVADALDAGDSDEFFKRLGRIARSVGRGIGSVARTVAPIASMIPLPQAQLIGRIANIAGKLLADGADEFELFDEMVDSLDEDELDAAAPILAGMVVRRALPHVSRAAPHVRRAAVHSVARAVRTATRRQGPPAARAVARVVTATRRVAQRRRVSPHMAVQIAQRAAQQVVRRPQTVRRLARPLVSSERRTTPRGQVGRTIARTVAPVARRVAQTTGRRGMQRGSGAGIGGSAIGIGGCPHCGARRLRLSGPVTITIRGAR